MPTGSSTPRSTNRFLILLGKVLRRLEHVLHDWQTSLLPFDEKSLKTRELEATRLRRLRVFFERARQISDATPGRYDRHGDPLTPQVYKVKIIEAQVKMYGAEDVFFRRMVEDAPLDVALTDSVRALLSIGSMQRARSFAQVLQSREESAEVGDVAMGLVGLRDRVPGTSWGLFHRVDIKLVMRLAPGEYFRTGFMFDPAAAADTLRHVLEGDLAADIDALGWLDIARTSFAAGLEAESLQALQRAKAGADTVDDPDFLTEIEWLEPWYGKAAQAQEPLEAPAGTIPFAVLDYKQPDRSYASRNLGDHVQTISSLGHVVRHSGLSFTGDPELVGVADTLQARVKPERRIDGDDATLALYRVDRDATSYFQVPDGTWAIAFGWYMHPIFKMRFDAPLNPRLRPIFISFHINAPALLTGDMIEYLKKYAPVGCRDWNTVHLLQAAGVPAFFSGCLTTTVDTVFPGPAGTPTKNTLWVDTNMSTTEDKYRQVFEEVRTRPFGENIADALQQLESYRSTYKHVVTSRLHCYLPSRSIGADVEFRPKNPADVRFDGLIGIDDQAFEAIRQGILTKLDTVVTAIAAGKSEDDVYALWREVCAPDVEAARLKRTTFEDIPEPTFDVAAACRSVHERSVTIERTAPAPAGDEVAVEFSLDGNLKQQLNVVLESVVAHASRPVRAYVLCRDHDQSDFERVAAAFPTVSFVWLPTDHVDYGEILGMIVHITVATMDRLLLPELLPDVPKIVHHDLDALCLGDVAELFDTELGDHPLAARTSPQPEARSGFVTIISASKRLKDNQQLARELIMRSHTRHTYDFLGFNAGIMVMNLDRMRRDEFCRHFLPYAERFGMHDQEVLNAYAGADRVELDADWNRLPRLEIIDHPKIVHWAGYAKPWRGDYVQFKELWTEYDERVTARVGTAPGPVAVDS